MAIGFFQNCGALTSTITVMNDPACLPACGVEAGPNILACQTTAQLNATPNTPGNYTYSWSPVAGLSDPTIANPTALHVDSVWYTVTITDVGMGCTASDSVLVAAYNPVFGTVYLCDSVLLDLGPGGVYDWQYWFDTLGNTNNIPVPNTDQTLWVDEPGDYLAIGFFSTCGALTSSITVVNDPACDSIPVYPGDCNNDGIANNIDYLYLGLAYSESGAPRATNSIVWQAHNALAWTGSFPTSNINKVYADCDGDGGVFSNDTSAILTNYSLWHSLPPIIIDSSTVNSPDLFFEVVEDSIMAGDTAHVNVYLGTNIKQLTDFYGIAFTITYDTAVVESNGVSFTFEPTSWLGTDGVDALSMSRDVWARAELDAAYTRIDHNGENGFGLIGHMEVVMQDDISGKLNLITETINFQAKDIVCYTSQEEPIVIRGEQDSVVVWMQETSIRTHSEAAELKLYPVPATTHVNVQATNALPQDVTLYNVAGQVVPVETTTINNRTVQLNVSALPAGIYLIEATVNGVPQWRKLQVQ
jgi:hypothetical protein